MSIQFVILIMIAIIGFITAFSEFEHQMLLRNLEASADLAAVEALREYVDETKLRDGELYLNPDDYGKIRDLYLKKIKQSVPFRTADVIAIGIPSVDSRGNVTLDDVNLTDLNHVSFPNSTAQFVASATPSKETTLSIANAKQGLQGLWCLGWNGVTADASKYAPMTIAKLDQINENNNKGVSGTKLKHSYVITAKITVLFKTSSLLNRLKSAALTYFDFLSNEPATVVTPQPKMANGKYYSEITAITIQSTGEVVLR